MGLAVCRALKVLCVADDAPSLDALRRATIAAEWELTPGATNETDALATIDAERPQSIVVFGPHDAFVALVRERFPAMRIVTDRETEGASAVARSHEDVRSVLRTLARPGGPIVDVS
jgi:hypothetical protein